jgi:hypothetical protein
MQTTVTTSTNKSFHVDANILRQLGKQDVCTFLCRRESHRTIRDAGFNPSEHEIQEQVDMLKLAEQFTRYGDTGYRDLALRVFSGRILSAGAERRLSEIRSVDVSDVDFRPEAIRALQKMWEFQCRLADTEIEVFYRDDPRLHTEEVAND